MSDPELAPPPADPSAPVDAPAERPWWERRPPGPATAQGMIRRAREEGRVLRPEVYEIAGIPIDPEPTPGTAPGPAADSAPAPAATRPAPEPGPAAPSAPPPPEPPGPAHPAGRGWIPASRDLGLPSDRAADSAPGAAGPFAAIASGARFTREHRVRFLDHLAFAGNARAAARRVAVSPETAYRARRQDPALAALWDAALVHARHYAESALATRALDGFEVEVWHRGELVGHQVRHDTRLLLAHLGRLDRRVERDTAACARAERFDDLLAEYAGHPAPEDFAEAAAEARAGAAAAVELPPTRAEYRSWCRGQLLEALAEDAGTDEAGTEEPGGDDDADSRAAAEIEALAALDAHAAAEYDAWHDGAVACVAAIVERPEAPPVELKSAPARPRSGGRETPPLNRVHPVNPGPRQAPSGRCAATSPARGGGSTPHASPRSQAEAAPHAPEGAYPPRLRGRRRRRRRRGLILPRSRGRWRRRRRRGLVRTATAASGAPVSIMGGWWTRRFKGPGRAAARPR